MPWILLKPINYNVMTMLLILINIILAVVGQTITKVGITKIGSFTDMPIRDFIIKAFLSPLVLTGLFLYIISAIIWFMVLSKVDLSVAYPTLSLGYIIILFVGYFYLGEPLSVIKFIGVLLICGGVYLIFS